MIQMTLLPIIMAPIMLKNQVNSDCDKKTLFDKKVKFGKNTFKALATLISEKRIDFLNLESISSDELRIIAKELHIKLSQKSHVRLLEEIKSICSAYIAGQGNQYLNKTRGL